MSGIKVMQQALEVLDNAYKDYLALAHMEDYSAYQAAINSHKLVEDAANDLRAVIAQAVGRKLVPQTMVLGSTDLRFLHGLSQPDDDGEYSEIRLTVGDGHAGHGLYASIEDYPEEGADIICKFSAVQNAI